MNSEPTQDEQDAAGGDEKLGAAGRYDFHHARRLTENQLCELKRVNERFSRDFAASLSALIRRRVTAGAVSLKQIKSPDSGDELTEIALVISLDIQPLDAPASLLLDFPLVFSLLEALLGGKTAETRNFDRELTEIELTLLEDLHGVIARELEKAWRRATPFTFQVRRQRTDFRPGPLDGAVIVTADLEIAGSSGRLALLYPPQIGKGIRDAATEHPQTPSARRSTMQQAVFEQLKSAMFDVDGCLLGSTLRLGDLLDLQVGDLVRLDVPLGRPIDVLINGQQRLQGQLIHSKRKKLLSIQHLFDPTANLASSGKSGKSEVARQDNH